MVSSLHRRLGQSVLCHPVSNGCMLWKAVFFSSFVQRHSGNLDAAPNVILKVWHLAYRMYVWDPSVAIQINSHYVPS
jgi:hypothetical protein